MKARKYELVFANTICSEKQKNMKNYNKYSDYACNSEYVNVLYGQHLVTFLQQLLNVIVNMRIVCMILEHLLLFYIFHKIFCKKSNKYIVKSTYIKNTHGD